MARSRRRDELVVSLFPFLSVLACVIGCLVLLITATAVLQLAEPAASIDWVAFEEIQEELARGSSQLEELEGKIAGGRADLARLDGVRALDRAETEIAALEKERTGLLATILKTNSEIERLQRRPDKLPTIVVQPSGSGRHIKPFFVECTRDSLIVHYRGRDPIGLPVTGSERLLDTRFRRFLLRVQAERDASVIFLIRPDGVLVYDRAGSMARQLGVRHGYLPLPGKGQLDLRLFEGS